MQTFAWADSLTELKERAWNTTPCTRFRFDKSQNDEILWERKIKKSKVFEEINCIVWEFPVVLQDDL